MCFVLFLFYFKFWTNAVGDFWGGSAGNRETDLRFVALYILLFLFLLLLLLLAFQIYV